MRGQSWLRAGTLAALSFGATWAFVCVVSQNLSLHVTWLGLANTLVASLICSWYVLDGNLHRRSFYELFGVIEPPLKPSIRFWRKVVLLTCALAAVGAAGIALQQDANIQSASPLIPPAALNQISILTAALIAGVGWMFTGFEKEKSDRAANTLTAIRDQLYGAQVSDTIRAIRLIIEKYRKKHGIPPKEPLPMAAMETQLLSVEKGLRPPSLPPEITLGSLVDQFFNALNQLAFGVRQGQFDKSTVEMVLRPRFVRHVYVFKEYIKSETDAASVGKGYFRSQKRTWEHLLWIVYHFPLLESDKIEPNTLVLPPDKVIEQIGISKSHRGTTSTQDRAQKNHAIPDLLSNGANSNREVSCPSGSGKKFKHCHGAAHQGRKK